MQTCLQALLTTFLLLVSCQTPGEAQVAVGSQFDMDCNGNGVEDAVDISIGFSSDENANGIPDECEALPVAQNRP